MSVITLARMIPEEPRKTQRGIPATQRSENRNSKMMKHRLREEARKQTDRPA